MRNLLISLILVLCFCGTAMGAGPDDVMGRWLNQEQDAMIEISRCGNLYCGKIIWLREPNYPSSDEKGMAGKTKVDRENPASPLRARPILGLEILKNFRYAGDNKWEDGSIYDPKNGKTYSCKMTLAGDKLRIRGYIGISLIGRTTVWSRAR
ncbi:MAG: DUF2147 domain-containing protein [Syntrophaceae bacterium]